jgi:hypothetical protein
VIRPRLIGGQSFTAAEVAAAGTVAIMILVLADGLVVGGLTFELDPKLHHLPHEEEREEEAKEEEKEAEEEEEEEEEEEKEERELEEEEEEHEHRRGVRRGDRRPRRVRLEIDLD